ncbi:MAG TPA: Ig-like domain-containing protein [Bacteroidia bacterium]|nr:Ig-like domain-containing protein [Bacteroidia bacterium]
MSKLLRFLFGIIAGLSFFGCAIQVPPGGGDKDIAPPVIEKMIPENYSTGFTGHDIVIRFDEFIVLKDIQSQLLVSPPLANPPETKVRKKTLFIHFEDTLREHSTYTFNFGNAIVDNNEGNVLENFQYVLSTGDVIDSLEIKGKAEFAFDHKTEKGILVMLYRQEDDSVVFRERPLYFAKTNDAGIFHVKNIAPGSYKVFALKYTGTDYQYSSTGESIAFPDSLVPAGSDDVRLYLFSEKPKFQLTRSYSEFAGKAVIAANGALDTVPIAWLSDTAKLNIHAMLYSVKKDTLTIWYKNIVADTLQFALKQGLKTDTITLRLFKFEGKQNPRQPFKLTADIAVSMVQPQDLNLPLNILFNHPVKVMDSSAIRLMTDSLQVNPLNISFADTIQRQLILGTEWKEGKSYHLFIPAGAIEDLYGLKNDTILLDFRTREIVDYGTVAVHYTGNPGAAPDILQLIDAKDQVIREAVVEADSVLEFNYLLPGSYRLKSIADENRNGIWDTGNYLKKIQPEVVRYYPEAIMVRANWDVDVKWNTGN